MLLVALLLVALYRHMSHAAEEGGSLVVDPWSAQLPKCKQSCLNNGY